MTSEGLRDIFEGDCAGKFSLMSIGGQAEGLACVDPGVRTPISVSGNFVVNCDLSGRRKLVCLYNLYVYAK